jgi:hypothetical protein
MVNGKSVVANGHSYDEELLIEQWSAIGGRMVVSEFILETFTSAVAHWY